MKKKVLTGVLTLAMLCGLLTGCGVTTESVLDRSTAKLESVKSQAADVSMTLGIDLKSAKEDVTMSMGVGFDGKVASTKTSDTDSISEINGKCNINLLGVSANLDIDAYADIKDDDKNSVTTLYIKTSEDDDWKAQSTTSEKVDKKDSGKFMDLLKSHLTLGKDTVEIDSVKCYELTGSLTGKELYDFAKTINTDITDDLDEDQSEVLDKLVAKITYDIDKRTYLPVKMVLDFKDSDLSSVFDETLGDDASIEVTDFNISVTYTQFDGVEVTLPDEVKDVKVNETTTDNLEESLKSNLESEVENEADVEEATTEVDTSDLAYGDDDLDYVTYVDNYYPHVNEDETFELTSYNLEEDSRIVVKVKNLTGDAVVGDGAIRYYDSNGNLVSASSITTVPINANGDCVVTAYYNKPFDSYEIALISDTIYDAPVQAKVEYLGKDDDGNAVFNMTNTGSDIDSNYSIILFYKGDTIVDCDYVYCDSGSDLKAGETAEFTGWSLQDWDTCELIPQGFAVKE